MTRERNKKTRSKAGATSRRPSRQQQLRALLPTVLRRGMVVALFCGIATAAVMLFVYGKDFIAHASARPIKSIGVQGHFVHVSREEISERVAPMIVGGFLQSPLSAIKQELELHPWIAQATVSRRWPDKLFISIVEEQPIARWAGIGFLNHRGDLIRVEQSDRLKALPLLSGEAGQEQAVMQHYQELAQMLRPHGLRIKEFHSNALMSRRLVLDNNVTIHLGRDHTLEKIQRFLIVYNRELQQHMDGVASVDLRYGNGLAVQWKQRDGDYMSELAGSEGCCKGEREVKVAQAVIDNLP